MIVTRNVRSKLYFTRHPLSFHRQLPICSFISRTLCLSLNILDTWSITWLHPNEILPFGLHILSLSPQWNTVVLHVLRSWLITPLPTMAASEISNWLLPVTQNSTQIPSSRLTCFLNHLTSDLACQLFFVDFYLPVFCSNTASWHLFPTIFITTIRYERRKKLLCLPQHF